MASILPSLPSLSLFRIPPLPGPGPLAPPPPSAHPSFPFAIPQDLYAAALDVRVPLTIGALYAASVKALNAYNRRRRAAAAGKTQPWPIARTRFFAAFVVAHNVLLAVYSAWSFRGMLRGLGRSVVSSGDPAGGGWAATVDSLCRAHGPPGLGNAVTWDDQRLEWMHLAAPDSDPHRSLALHGRMWNEGIAFYGWIFYLSKFYEVFDTLIILAKGKTSSVLQTYHHTGAMLAVWAGIKYMSAPIWMFVLINSGIHALMYTYYTLTAFSIYVPVAVKRTLTTIQITQFVVGSSYAVLHSFISYTVPVTVPITPPAVEDEHAAPVSASASTPSSSSSSSSSSSPDYQTVYVTQPCITTSGATFAVWLNVLYLAPLTVLFVNFFISSYLRRSGAAGSAKGPTAAKQAEKSGAEAAGRTKKSAL